MKTPETKEEEFTEEEMKEAYDKCDGCMSCGWKSSWYELDYGDNFYRTGREGFPDEFTAGCFKDEGEDVSDHRGYYIYPEHKK